MPNRVHKKMTVQKRRDYVASHGLQHTWYWSLTNRGTTVFEASLNSMPFPVAIMWTNQVGNTTMEVLGMYVLESLRRAGLGRGLLDYSMVVETKVDCIMTQSGTRLGADFMDRYGFKQQKNGDWTYKVKRA